MPRPNYFLKMVGAADWPIEDRWIDQRSDLLYGVRTPRQPRAIKSGDLLVHYAAGAQELFATARATQDGSNVPESAEPGEHRWPFRIPVQMYLAVPTLTMAPHWSVLGLPNTTVQQKSYGELNASQYKVAFDAIVERGRP
ncbi:MAG: hypothetical protein QOH12_1481 [Solirubrobacteraceae bacterium]|nr:hypothetical protein [Solirubrobacteraceae bacterium]